MKFTELVQKVKPCVLTLCLENGCFVFFVPKNKMKPILHFKTSESLLVIICSQFITLL